VRVASIGECMLELSALGDENVLAPGTDLLVEAGPVDDVVDTTAAGDSFAAAYVAARLAGAEPAARASHLLAGTVVRYPGAHYSTRGHAGSRDARIRSRHQ
jgi:sugar/nucleoside kinase (ribokinase family)